jgi:YfiR/HmsC-like
MIRPHPISRLLTLILLFGMSDAVFSHGQEINASQVRAMMIVHLTKFIDWPAVRNDAHTSFVLCVLDDDQVGAYLGALLANKTVQGRPVLIRRDITMEQAEKCHVLYWAHPKRKQIDSMMQALLKASVLTVSEDHQARSGTMIGLPIEDGHVSIDINRSMAQYAHLTLSSRLLQIAAESR